MPILQPSTAPQGLPAAIPRTLRALIIICITAGVCQADQASTDAPDEFLAPGLKLRCDFGDGQVDRYGLLLNGQQTLRISVDQRGVDVAVKLKDPYGDVLFSRDGLTGPVGEEVLIWVIDESGRHDLEIVAAESPEPPGCYQVSYQVSETVAPQDRLLASSLASALSATDPDLDKDEAVRRLSGAYSQIQAVGSPSVQAETLIWLSELYLGDDPDTALTYLNQALEMTSADPAQLAYANVLIGGLYRTNPVDLEKSHEHLQTALTIWKEIFGAHYWEGMTAQRLGLVNHALGEFHETIYYFNLAVQRFQELHLQDWLASSLMNRGWVHFYLDRVDQAADDFSTALAISERHELKEQVIALTMLAYVHTRRGEYEEALRLIDRALQLRVGQRRGIAVTNIARGWVRHRQGKYAEALEIYREALEVFQGEGDKGSEAKALYRIALTYQQRGEHNEALRYFNLALGLFRSLGSADGEAEALLGVARSERALNQLDNALMKTNEAIEIVEALRKRPYSWRLRALFFASKLHFYDFKIDLLMALHALRGDKRYDIEALAVSEQARARSLLETLSDSGVDLHTDIAPALLAKEKQLRRRMMSIFYQSQKQSKGTRELRTSIRQLELDHDRITAQIRSADPLYASMTEVMPLSVEEIQQSIVDNETLLLEYHLGERNVFLWAVTPDTVKSVALDIKPKQIEETARLVYRLLRVGRQRKYRGQLEWELGRLSERLLSPVAEQLQGKKRVLIISGGALQYVPFAALPIPESTQASGWPARLFSKHEIVSIPSASALAILRKTSERSTRKDRGDGSPTAAVLADPVFQPDDDRVPNHGQTTRGDVKLAEFERLVHSLKEAEAIRSILPQAKIATGFAASKKLATSDELSEYRYIHFATHGTFDAAFPERSGLVLSLYDEDGNPLDGKLHLSEIYRLGLSADLVVLSACQTALGEEIRGEGLVGLAQGFMYSGAPRIIASLWNVLDSSTAAFMELFYDKLLVGEMTPSAALRAAQLQFLERYPKWSEPFYWAGFVLIGDF